MRDRVSIRCNGHDIEIFRPDVDELLKGGNKMNKVKMYRSGANITQEHMAKVLGLSKPTYVSRENGESDWKLEEMKTFVNEINVTTGKTYTISDIFLD